MSSRNTKPLTSDSVNSTVPVNNNLKNIFSTVIKGGSEECNKDAFFSFSSYHVVLVVVGVIVILARWLPRLVSKREPAAAPLMIMFGAAAALLVPNMPILPNPRQMPLPWELVSELTVIVALFGAGMRIDSLRPWKRWMPTFRMLAISMPLTILAVTLLGVTLGGLTLAGAILLGAVLAPTDPVLAADVQQIRGWRDVRRPCRQRDPRQSAHCGTAADRSVDDHLLFRAG